MSIEEFNILIAGVGGQGGLTLSRIIGHAAVLEGYRLRIGETLGMSQRGGAVVSFVRFGNRVFSPLIPERDADILFGLEPIEALRNIKFVGEKTAIILNIRKIPPLIVNLGLRKYPDLEEILSFFKKITSRIHSYDFSIEAQKLGNIRVMNTIMLGAAFGLGLIPLKSKSIEQGIRSVVPRKYLELNLKAFEVGKKIGKDLFSFD